MCVHVSLTLLRWEPSDTLLLCVPLCVHVSACAHLHKYWEATQRHLTVGFPFFTAPVIPPPPAAPGWQAPPRALGLDQMCPESPYSPFSEKQDNPRRMLSTLYIYIYVHTQLLYFLLWLAFLYEDEIPPISGWNVSWHTFLIRVMWRKQSRCYYLPFFSIGHPARAMVSAGPTEREESRPGQLWWESRDHLPTHGLSDLGEVTKCSGSSLLQDGDDGNYCTELFLKWHII